MQAASGGAETQKTGKGMGWGGGDSAQYNVLPSRSTDHSMVTNAYKAWNAAVIRASDSLIDVIYGDSDGAAAGGKGKSS